MNRPGSNSVCAVVVAYHPDSGFEDRLRIVLPQVQRLLVVDNTPGGGCVRQLAGLIADPAAEQSVQVVENMTNRGIAAALNQGIKFALESGCKWLLTLDQDTVCHPDMAATLLEVDAGSAIKPAIIGSNYLDPRKPQAGVRSSSGYPYRTVKTVITSGCLLDVRVADAIGGFREDYFIDQVDHEFCLRARSRGHQVVITDKAAMTHSVGRPGGARLPVLGMLPNHPPLRKYYIARNSIVTVAQYWRLEPMWCLRRTVRLILGLFLMATLEQQRVMKVRAFAAGVADGFNRRMGACKRTFLRSAE